ncbi:hypothetical protein BDF20DRAFT_848838 [Mycotypha africana]|uniref:uncharacterized protein n=1 Tax=Mycotypha africana TaxID=64632 RepID=UPI0022FFFD9D|nr:uncharacterized protein BDF20DRAFT_848838 [Mycotypha africana]KAI8992190.1 hypothetical protein BDF20DRAFT_848838 [Mycotypha africana]
MSSRLSLRSRSRAERSMKRNENDEESNKVTLQTVTKNQLLKSSTPNIRAESPLSNIHNDKPKPATSIHNEKQKVQSDEDSLKTIPAKRQSSQLPISSDECVKRQSISTESKQPVEPTHRHKEEEQPFTFDDLTFQYDINDIQYPDTNNRPEATGPVHYKQKQDGGSSGKLQSNMEIDHHSSYINEKPEAIQLPPLDESTIEYAPPKLPVAFPEPPMGLEDFNLSIFDDVYFDVAPIELVYVEKKPEAEVVLVEDIEDDAVSISSLGKGDEKFNSWDLYDFVNVQKPPAHFDINDISDFEFPEIYKDSDNNHFLHEIAESV